MALPVHQPDRLVELNDTITNPIWEAIRDSRHPFSGVFVHSNAQFNLAARGETQMVSGMFLSGDAFQTLGLTAQAGRLFGRREDRRGTPDGPVAVLTDAYWRRAYAGRPEVVGQSVVLDGHPFTIIGVTPRSFTGLIVGRTVDIITPLAAEGLLRGARSNLDARGAYWLILVGRLAPVQTIDAAQAALGVMQPSIREATLPTDWAASDLKQYLSEPLTLREAGGFSPLRLRYTRPLLVLMVVVSLVLLVACANLANLLLARGAARQRELAVRLSLGASRRGLVRQMLGESLLMCSAGALAGIGLAYLGVRGLLALIAGSAARVGLDVAVIDLRVLGFSVALAVLTTIVCGLVPALRATRLDPVQALRPGGRGIEGGPRRFGLPQALIGLQLALSTVLVIGAALFARSFVAMATADLGFDESRILTTSLDLRSLVVTGEARMAQVDRMVEHAAAAPGVEVAALGLITPTSGMGWLGLVRAEGFTPQSERDSRTNINAVSPGFLCTLGTPLLAGRDFDARDRAGSPSVAIVNEFFAAKFLKARLPVGARFERRSGDRYIEVEVVGLAANSKYRSQREDTSAVMYLPIAQQPQGSIWDFIIFTKTRGAPAAAAATVASAIAEIDPDVVVSSVPMADMVAGGRSLERTVAWLSGFFGVLALLLAVVGLYGVTSYAVTRRRSEIGLRLALGAAPSRVWRRIVLDVMVVLAAGTAAGVAGAIAASRFIAALLYGIAPTDATTLATAVGVLSVSALVAAALPARRAARLDPMVALREE
jgi:predicted permease